MLTVLLTCFFIVSSISSKTPRSRTSSVGWTTLRSISRARSSGFSWRREAHNPNQISSVLVALTWSLRDTSRSCSSWMQDERRWRQLWDSPAGRWYIHCEPKKPNQMCFDIQTAKPDQLWQKLVHIVLSKFFIQKCKRFPPHLNNVSTLPRET